MLQPRETLNGLIVYPAYNRNGKLIWVTIPDSE